MITPGSAVYLETSALNYLADTTSSNDGRASHIYHQLRGTKFLISSTTIWEVLLTSNELRRERLIHHAQHLCHRELINSPAEFIVNYIKSGCPREEERYNFFSQSRISEVWSGICDDRRKTFIFDPIDLKNRMKVLTNTFKFLANELNQFEVIKSPHDKISLIELLTSRARKVDRLDFDHLVPNQKKKRLLTLLFIFYLFCNEIGIDPTPYTEFWQEVGIKDPIERLDYLMLNHDALITCGPFVVFSEMAFTQLRDGGKITRGVLWDILHCINVVYTEVFLTNDAHFQMLRNQSGFFQLYNILHMSEIDWITKREIKIIE